MGASLQKAYDTKINYQLVYSMCNRNLDRYWTGALKSSEYQVIKYIINRTIRFNKPSEIILRNYIGNDILSKRGEVIQSGIAVSASTYTRCLATLRKLDIISTKIITTKRGRGNLVTVNIPKLMEKPVSKLIKAKKDVKKTTKFKGGSGHSDSIGSGHSDAIEVKTDNIEQTEIKTPDEPDILQSLKAVRDKKEAKRSRPTREDSFQGMKNTWGDTYESLFPKSFYTNFTAREFKMLRRNMKSISEDIPMRSFIRWAMENWMYLSGTKMAWAVEKGLMTCDPSPSAFSMLVRKFLEHYMHHKTEGTRLSVTLAAVNKSNTNVPPIRDMKPKAINMKSIAQKPKRRKIDYKSRDVSTMSEEELTDLFNLEWRD